MCAQKPAFPAVMAAMMADTPPPITVWNLGLAKSQKRGEMETAFMGSSCLKQRRISRVSGSRILEPLSAAVARMEKFLLKAMELILTPSWMAALMMMLPFMSQWMMLPSVVATKKDWLSTYHSARVEVLISCLSCGTSVAKSVSLGMRSTASLSLGGTSAARSVLKLQTLMRLGVQGLYQSWSSSTRLDPQSNSTCFNLQTNLIYLIDLPVLTSNICISLHLPPTNRHYCSTPGTVSSRPRPANARTPSSRRSPAAPQ